MAAAQRVAAQDTVNVADICTRTLSDGTRFERFGRCLLATTTNPNYSPAVTPPARFCRCLSAVSS